jgi:hypothetical protein
MAFKEYQIVWYNTNSMYHKTKKISVWKGVERLSGCTNDKK